MLRADELNTVVALVERVGACVLQARAAGLQVREKSPGDPVSSADEMANEMLVTGLAALFPEAGLVAEESANGESAWRERGLTLFVDPIDGTRDFVAGGDDFAVMVGAVEDGVPVWGMVYEPAKKQWVFGGPAGVEICVDGHRETLTVPPRQYAVSDSILVVSRSRSGGTIGQLVDSLGAREVRRVGGMGTKLMQVATNAAQGFVQPIGGGYTWDSAAGEAVLRALGMRMTDAYGNALSYQRAHNLRSHGIVAAPAALHAELLARLDVRAREMAAAGAFPSWTPRLP